MPIAETSRRAISFPTCGLPSETTTMNVLKSNSTAAAAAVELLFKTFIVVVSDGKPQVGKLIALREVSAMGMGVRRSLLTDVPPQPRSRPHLNPQVIPRDPQIGRAS